MFAGYIVLWSVCQLFFSLSCLIKCFLTAFGPLVFLLRSQLLVPYVFCISNELFLSYCVRPFLLVWLAEFLLWCVFFWISAFILFGVYWVSWMCRLLFFNKFRKFSVITFSDIFSFSPSDIIHKHNCHAYWYPVFLWGFVSFSLFFFLSSLWLV